MAFKRGIYGIEYNPRRPDDESGLVGLVVLVVALLAVASLAWALVSRFRASDEKPVAQPQPAEVAAAAASQAVVVTQAVTAAVKPMEPAIEASRLALMKRPVRVRNLLMRLEEAERANDVEMAVATIEQLRALPGAPAADLDDSLAHRLGLLNIKRLFVLKNAQWVKTVTVKAGDSASRIAFAHGATLSSMAKLNGKVDKVLIGQKLLVMNHPRFNLVIHRSSRIADLQLNGKFFKRYDLTAPVSGKVGPYETTKHIRQFFTSIGVQFSASDRAELECLLPPGASVLISET